MFLYRRLDLVVYNFASFRKCLRWRRHWRRAGEPQPVLVVDRDDEADLARQIEPMEVVSFGLEDHRVSGAQT